MLPTTGRRNCLLCLSSSFFPPLRPLSVSSSHVCQLSCRSEREQMVISRKCLLANSSEQNEQMPVEPPLPHKRQDTETGPTAEKPTGGRGETVPHLNPSKNFITHSQSEANRTSFGFNCLFPCLSSWFYCPSDVYTSGCFWVSDTFFPLLSVTVFSPAGLKPRV